MTIPTVQAHGATNVGSPYVETGLDDASTRAIAEKQLDQKRHESSVYDNLQHPFVTSVIELQLYELIEKAKTKPTPDIAHMAAYDPETLTQVKTSGGMSTFYQVKTTDGSETRMLKVDRTAHIYKNMLSKDDLKRRLMREINTHRDLSSIDSVLEMKAGYVTPGYKRYVGQKNLDFDVYSVMDQEHFAGKPLDKAMKDASLPVRMEIVNRIMRTLYEVHNKGYAHRDVKPDNILVDEDGNFRLLDFGLTEKVSTEFANTIDFSPEYAAPEPDGTCTDTTR